MKKFASAARRAAMHCVVMAGVCAWGAASAEPVPTTVLSQLDKYEPFEGHQFHAGHLWVGRSRQDLGAFYRLEVYDPAGKPVATGELTHSARFISPYGPDAVLVVGIATDQLSHYTIARINGGRLEMTARTIPLGALADRFVGEPGRLIFSDPGGFDDPDHPSDPGKPLQTLFSFTGGQGRWLKPRFSMPQRGQIIDGVLWLLTSPGIGLGNRFLRTVDLRTEADAVVLDNLGDAQKMVHLPHLNVLVLGDGGKGALAVFDLKTRQVTRSIPVTGGAMRSIAAYGRCIIAGIEEARTVEVYDPQGASDKPLASWDLSGAGADLLAIRDVAADPRSGRVYVRSAYACSPVDSGCGPLRNSVVMATPEISSEVRSACLAP